MEQQGAALGGEGVKEPVVAEPTGSLEAKNPTPATSETKERSEVQSRAEDAKYAAARRRAEAERDEFKRQSEMERRAEQSRFEQLRRELDAEKVRTQDERARIVAEEQLRQISEIDRSVKSVDDLMAMPEFDDFYALVKKGVTLVEAYKLTHYDALMQQRAAYSARETRHSVASRAHLSALGHGSGKGEYLSVPAEVAAQFRLSKPGITDAEIRRKYRRYQKYQRQ